MGSHRFGGALASRSGAGNNDEASKPRLGTRLADSARHCVRNRMADEQNTEFQSLSQVAGMLARMQPVVTSSRTTPPISPPSGTRDLRGAAQDRPGRDGGSPRLQFRDSFHNNSAGGGPAISSTAIPRSTRGFSSVPVSGQAFGAPPSPGAQQVGIPTPILGPRSLPFDADKLFTELLGHGLLSACPRVPPWSPDAVGKSDIEAVRGWLTNALPSAEVRVVLRVDCVRSSASAAYEGVRKTLGPERLLWHGTSWDSVANIVRHGFNRAYGGRHGAKLGKGSYFTEDAAYALRFCGRTPTRALFLAGVLPGRCCKGEDSLVEPPADITGARFDSTVDDPERPKVFCVFRDFQALPLYVAEVGCM